VRAPGATQSMLYTARRPPRGQPAAHPTPNPNPLRPHRVQVRVNKPSAEARERQLKQCSVLAEKAKQDIRAIRKKGMDKLAR
jgi:hypothetical protein